MIKDILLVILGSGLGGGTRYALSLLFRATIAPKFLFLSTLSVNLIGSFAMGLIIANLTSAPHNHWFKLLVAVGFCGGFTTFSSFSNEVVDLARQGHYWLSLIYIWCSVGVSLLMVSLAHFISK